MDMRPVKIQTVISIAKKNREKKQSGALRLLS
jgi:hypothetical protein